MKLKDVVGSVSSNYTVTSCTLVSSNYTVTSSTLSVGFDFDSTVLCKFFDEIELLIRGDSPSIFPPLNKM